MKLKRQEGFLLYGSIVGYKVSKDASIKFGHVTDTHVTFTGRNGTSLFEESSNIFRDIIDQITEMGAVDFVLFGGDNINNTDLGTRGFDKFMNIMSSVKIPYFYPIW